MIFPSFLALFVAQKYAKGHLKIKNRSGSLILSAHVCEVCGKLLSSSIMNFDFNQNHILENEVVQLRPLTMDDFEHLKHFVKQRPIWAYSSIRVDDEADLKNYLQLAMDGKSKLDEYPFIVFDKRTRKYAGSTRFYDIQLAKQTLQLGYTWYGEDFHGTGLNKNCKLLLLEFAFEKMSMERVEFRANNLNERSIAAMKSIGCTVEGVLRQNLPHHTNAIRRDTIVLSILKDEWFGGVKENLKNKV